MARACGIDFKAMPRRIGTLACPDVMPYPTCILPRACSDALESHVAEVVGAEVSRTLAKCGLAEVVARLQEVQVRGTEP